MVLPAPSLEEPPVDHILGQRVPEAIHRLGIADRREDEVEAVELAEPDDRLVPGDLDDPREQGDSRSSADDCGPLQGPLEWIGEPVDASGDDVVDRGGHRDALAPQAGLTILHDDP